MLAAHREISRLEAKDMMNNLMVATAANSSDPNARTNLYNLLEKRIRGHMSESERASEARVAFGKAVATGAVTVVRNKHGQE